MEEEREELTESIQNNIVGHERDILGTLGWVGLGSVAFLGFVGALVWVFKKGFCECGSGPTSVDPEQGECGSVAFDHGEREDEGRVELGMIETIDLGVPALTLEPPEPSNEDQEQTEPNVRAGDDPEDPDREIPIRVPMGRTACAVCTCVRGFLNFVGALLAASVAFIVRFFGKF